jgi:hypothetical protein
LTPAVILGDIHFLVVEKGYNYFVDHKLPYRLGTGGAMWKIFKPFFEENPDEKDVKCPFCTHQAKLKDFAYWSRNGVNGFRGKLPNGDMVIACPACLIELKYDVLEEKIVVYKL